MALGWEVVVTLIGAFGAASTAQYYSHKLTLKREDEKYKKEQYQNLYSPLIFQITNYILSEGQSMWDITLQFAPERYKRLNEKFGYPPRLIELPETESIFNEIMDLLEKNLKYADASIIRAYEQFKSHLIGTTDPSLPNNDKKAIEEEKREHFLEERMKMCERFLSEYLKISEEIATLPQDLKNELKSLYYGVKLFNLSRKYNFKLTGYALLEFTAIGYKGWQMLRIPEIAQLTLDIERNVDYALEQCRRNTGKKEDINAYYDFKLLIEHIVDYLSLVHPTVKFIDTLTNSMNQDIKEIERN